MPPDTPLPPPPDWGPPPPPPGWVPYPPPHSPAEQWWAPGQPPPGWLPPVPPGYVATRPAGFWRRFAAVLIDSMIVGFFAVPAIIVQSVGPTEERLCDRLDGPGVERCEVPTQDTAELALILLVGAQVATLGYYALLEGKKGHTIGKQILGLRVVDARHGGLIGPWRAQGRYLARILSTLPLGLGYFWSLWDRRRQTWHDKIVKAVVIRDGP